MTNCNKITVTVRWLKQYNRLMKTQQFTDAEYEKLIQRKLFLRREHLRLMADRTSNSDSERHTIRLELDQLRKVYIERLPILFVSLCPYCQQPLLRRFDPQSLNGSWWSPLWHHPNEPLHCKHFFVMTGALNLNGFEPTEVESKDGIYPGPELPFVIPRLLNYADMVAVIYSIKVANKYTGFPIVYFGLNLPPATELTQAWGRTRYAYGNDQFSWLSREEEYDFEVYKWIKARKVYWIEGFEPTLITGEADRYPFLHLRGRRSFYFIRKGRVGV